MAFRAGRSKGNGIRKSGGLDGVLLGDCDALSYEGGGSAGAKLYLTSVMFSLDTPLEQQTLIK